MLGLDLTKLLKVMERQTKAMERLADVGEAMVKEMQKNVEG